ncbi:MAG: hypothetical protein CL760_12940 [Chloroflexi bacterium]|nr:hypothetical protein [Chloroflexota bacterium]|tara:strand:- start:60874 stop:61671 length:798 start_codon:yes stop_codon:yes gene_type:complete
MKNIAKTIIDVLLNKTQDFDIQEVDNLLLRQKEKNCYTDEISYVFVVEKNYREQILPEKTKKNKNLNERTIDNSLLFYISIRYIKNGDISFKVRPKNIKTDYSFSIDSVKSEHYDDAIKLLTDIKEFGLCIQKLYNENKIKIESVLDSIIQVKYDSVHYERNKRDAIQKYIEDHKLIQYSCWNRDKISLTTIKENLLSEKDKDAKTSFSSKTLSYKDGVVSENKHELSIEKNEDLLLFFITDENNNRKKYSQKEFVDEVTYNHFF